MEAVVIYNWYDVSSNPDVGAINASIAFDESIWSFGGAFVYDSSLLHPTEAQPFFGVASIDFATPMNMNSTPHIDRGFTDPIQLSQMTCAQAAPPGLDPSNYCAGRGMAVEDIVVSAGYWSFDLVFGEFLQGSMYLNDHFTDVRMSSHDTLFTIDSLNSDSPGSCFSKPARCAGGTGVWQLATAPMPVSEPSTVLLLTLGLIPLVVTHRRRVTKPSAKAV